MKTELKAAILNGVTITTGNHSVVANYLNEYNPSYVMQYNVTPTWLLDEYRWTEFRGQILIYKLKPFLQYKIAQIEMLPNLTEAENIQFLEAAHSLGMQVRLNEYEYNHFKDKIPFKLKTVDTAKGDFIYSKQHNWNLDGKDWADFRTGINRLQKDSAFEIKFIEEMTPKVRGQIFELLDKYVAMKKERGNKTSFTFHLRKYSENFEHWHTGERAIQLIYHNGELMAFSISEKINDTNISMPDRKSLLPYLPKMQHAFRAMNWLDIDYWCRKDNGNNDDIFFNFGSAGDSKDLYETKRRMNPYIIMKNYKFQTVPDLDDDILYKIKPKKKGLF